MNTRLTEARYRLERLGFAAAVFPSVLAWHNLLHPERKRPPKSVQKILKKRTYALMAEDLNNLRSGLYGPSVLLDFPTKDWFRLLPRAAYEMSLVLQRRRRGGFLELPQELDLDSFPAYYKQTFHWQSDGYLSHRSAEFYEVGVEFLFLGFAQAMRRMALPPLIDCLENKKAPHILDIACGVGTFTYLLRQVFPDAFLYGVDLSPYYLKKAVKRLPPLPPTSFVADNAEHLSFRDAHFDALSCVYLFHELPPKARRNVVAEAHRVLKKGGLFVVCDSAQLNDSQALEIPLSAFPSTYHEPFYKNYLISPLETLLSDGGFEVLDSKSWLTSKVVVAKRV